MKFEFDQRKSDTNQTKHGIDFETSQAIWLDVNRLEIPARSLTEARFQVVGWSGGEVWSAFVRLARRRNPNHFRTPRTPGGESSL